MELPRTALWVGNKMKRKNNDAQVELIFLLGSFKEVLRILPELSGQEVNTKLFNFLADKDLELQDASRIKVADIFEKAFLLKYHLMDQKFAHLFLNHHLNSLKDDPETVCYTRTLSLLIREFPEVFRQYEHDYLDFILTKLLDPKALSFPQFIFHTNRTDLVMGLGLIQSHNEKTTPQFNALFKELEVKTSLDVFLSTVSFVIEGRFTALASQGDKNRLIALVEKRLEKVTAEEQVQLKAWQKVYEVNPSRFQPYSESLDMEKMELSQQIRSLLLSQK